MAEGHGRVSGAATSAVVDGFGEGERAPGREAEREGSGERVGEWERGVGAWHPYPLSALPARGCDSDQTPVATRSHEQEERGGTEDGGLAWRSSWAEAQ